VQQGMAVVGMDGNTKQNKQPPESEKERGSESNSRLYLGSLLLSLPRATPSLSRKHLGFTQPTHIHTSRMCNNKLRMQLMQLMQLGDDCGVGCETTINNRSFTGS
jgi:hypothetical protein